MNGNAMPLISRRGGQQSGLVSPMEGRFRQALVYKGRNRDTDWLSMIDKDWPAVKSRLEKWLKSLTISTKKGQQIKALSDF